MGYDGRPDPVAAPGRELAAILEDGKALPPIAWTISPSGLMLTGRVNGLVPVTEVRVVFDVWRRALRLDDVLETRASDAETFLRARTRRGSVRVAVTASVVSLGGSGESSIGTEAMQECAPEAEGEQMAQRRARATHQLALMSGDQCLANGRSYFRRPGRRSRATLPCGRGRNAVLRE